MQTPAKLTIRIFLAAALLLAAGYFAVTAAAQDSSALKSAKEKYSYALGMDLGKQLRKRSIEVDSDLFSKGLRDALSGGKTLLTEEEGRASIAVLQAEAKRKQMLPSVTVQEDGQKPGQAFLAENKKKEGVVTLPSGLQYKILKAGDGKKPTGTDTVVCNYRGTLIDGTEFDSSYKRNQPQTIPVQGVIPGWKEGLQLMAVGSKYQFFIPPELAYKQYGFGYEIGPNATLIFEVELLEIK